MLQSCIQSIDSGEYFKIIFHRRMVTMLIKYLPKNFYKLYQLVIAQEHLDFYRTSL